MIFNVYTLFNVKEKVFGNPVLGTNDSQMVKDLKEVFKPSIFLDEVKNKKVKERLENLHFYQVATYDSKTGEFVNISKVALSILVTGEFLYKELYSDLELSKLEEKEDLARKKKKGSK